MDHDTESSIITDERGVAPLIGFILLFAIGVVAFSGYQAVQVPQQNAATEFQHSQDVQNDLIGVRSSISTAGQADVSQFPTVKLGTDYRTRILALNPPSATGTLQTSDAYPIIIENEDGDSEEVDTRFLQYQPGYNELNSRPIWYENSVLYVDAREDGGVAILEDQNLVVDDDTLRITALQNEFQRSGTGRITLELYPTRDVTAEDIPEGDLTVTLPTRLGPEYWEEAIDLDEGEFEVTDDGTYEDDDYDVYALKLENIDTSEGGELKLNTVGIQSEPSEGDVGIGDGKKDVTVTGSTDGNVFSTGNLIIKDGVEVGGNAEADGSVTLEGEAAVEGGITSGGDVTLGDESEVDGDIDADGDVTLEGEAAVEGGITSGGNVTLGEGSEVDGDIDADGDVTLEGEAAVEGGITSGGNVTLGEGSEVSGDINVESGDNIICGDGSEINEMACEDYVEEEY